MLLIRSLILILIKHLLLLILFFMANLIKDGLRIERSISSRIQCVLFKDFQAILEKDLLDLFFFS